MSELIYKMIFLGGKNKREKEICEALVQRNYTKVPPTEGELALLKDKH